MLQHAQQLFRINPRLKTKKLVFLLDPTHFFQQTYVTTFSAIKVAEEIEEARAEFPINLCNAFLASNKKSTFFIGSNKINELM